MSFEGYKPMAPDAKNPNGHSVYCNCHVCLAWGGACACPECLAGARLFLQGLTALAHGLFAWMCEP